MGVFIKYLSFDMRLPPKSIVRFILFSCGAQSPKLRPFLCAKSVYKRCKKCTKLTKLTLDIVAQTTLRPCAGKQAFQ